MDIEVLNLVPFLKLRRLLNLALMPVCPRAAFRRELGQKLVSDATKVRLMGAAVIGTSLLMPARRDLLLGAALGWAVSLAGLVAYLIHIRLSRDTDRQAA